MYLPDGVSSEFEHLESFLSSSVARAGVIYEFLMLTLWDNCLAMEACIMSGRD